MNTLTFVCLAVVCGSLGIINTLFNKLVGWKGIAVRGLFVFSLITFALITSNLTAINNALSLFISLALALMLLAEATCVAMGEEEKAKPVVNGVFFSVSCVLFALSAVSLAEFALLPFLGGLFAGVGVGLIICAIKKQKGLNQILMNILTFACIGLFIGLSVNSVLTSKHMISAICMLGGSVLLLIQRALVSCGKGKIVNSLASALYSIGLIALTLSIYFY